MLQKIINAYNFYYQMKYIIEQNRLLYCIG